MDNLSLQSKLIKELDTLSYPDSNRIAKEIIAFSEESKTHSIDEIIKRLQNHEPWEYIRGWTEFYGRKFKVSKAVLIPRIETESLIDLALTELKNNPAIKEVIDVGTGSGVIAITLALQTDLTRVFATDISEKASEVFLQNSKQHGTEDRINFALTNIIENLEIPNSNTPTLFVANLPYIPDSEYERLDASVKDWEPAIALKSGSKGIDHYTDLIEQTTAYQTPIYLLEITKANVAALENLAKKHMLSIEFIKDTFDRVRFARLQK